MEHHPTVLGFPGGSVVKNPPVNAGNTGSIPGWGRSPGEGNGNPLQYSCLGNATDRGAWWATSPWGGRVGHDLATEHAHTPLYYFGIGEAEAAELQMAKGHQGGGLVP